MQVACEHCGTEYSLDKDNITGRGVRITCPSCSHVFTVYKPQEEIEIEIDLDIEEEIDLDIDEDIEEEIEIELELEEEIDLDIDEDIEEVALEEVIEKLDANADIPDGSSEEIDMSPELEDLPAVTEEALAAIDVNTLDFQKVGIQAWKVKTSIGLVYEFSDYKTLKHYIQKGQVKESDPLSYDGTWPGYSNV